MAKIIGNTTATPNPRPDWNQTDETKADYIKNKPTDLATGQDVTNTLAEAKSYTDTKIAGLASADIINTSIGTHNTSTSAHNDIRALITDLTTKLNNFLDVDDTTTDQLSELIALIQDNATDIETITSGKVNVSDIIDNLTTNVSNQPLSAAQGVTIKALIDSLQTQLDSKVPTSRTVNGKELSADVTLSAADVGASASGHTHDYLSLSGGNLTGVLGVNKKYELGTFFDYQNGCLIDIAQSATSTMVVIHVTGNSYSLYPPIDSWFQFYDYGQGALMHHAGIHLGYDLGNMIVYRYNGRLYAYIAQDSRFKTLSFTLLTNKAGLSPTVSDSAAHTSGYTDLITITPTKNVTSANISSQTAASASKLTTARKINGVDFDGTSDIAVYSANELPWFAKRLKTNQWYRIATITETHGFSCTLQFTSSYDYTIPQSTTLAINARYDTDCSIVQLSNTNVSVISKVRAVRKRGAEWYIEIYYAGDTQGNPVQVAFSNIASYAEHPNTIITKVDFTDGTIPDGYTATEFELSSNPVKATAFEGDLVGVATKAISDENGNNIVATYATKDEIANAGAGDMLRSVYDTNNNGVVDNAEKLGGIAASSYALKSDISYPVASVNGKTGTVTLSTTDLGLTATTTELNYVDGVTSNVQTQLDTLSSDVENRMPLDNDGAIQIVSGDDLNNFKTPGIYICPSGSVAASLVNPPMTGSGFKLVVMAGYILERVTQYVTTNTNQTLYRKYTGSAWTSWATLYTTDNPPSAASITYGTLSSDRLPVVPIAKGGTGATTAEQARTNLGIPNIQVSKSGYELSNSGNYVSINCGFCPDVVFFNFHTMEDEPTDAHRMWHCAGGAFGNTDNVLLRTTSTGFEINDDTNAWSSDINSTIFTYTAVKFG